MITVYHLKSDLTRDQRLSVTDPLTDEISALLDQASQTDRPEAERKRASAAYRQVKVQVRVAAATALLAADGYEAVARIDTDDLEVAYRLTQNIENSWSREAHAQVSLLLPGVIVARGTEYGRKSSEVGDLFATRDGRYVVDSVGFARLGQ